MPSIAQLLQHTGLVGSLSEARRTVKEGGAYLNNERVTDADAVPADDAWLAGGWLVLRRGKRPSPGCSGRRAYGLLTSALPVGPEVSRPCAVACPASPAHGLTPAPGRQ